MKLKHIFTCPELGFPMIEHKSIQVIAHRGLEGDRYSTDIAKGAYSEKRTGKVGRIPDGDRQISIISMQAIVEANAELAAKGFTAYEPIQLRRNLVVVFESEALNGLVGKTFELGGIQMEGVELCTPCKRPPTLLGRKEGNAFEIVFATRGGIRARVLTTGTLSVEE